VFVQSLTVSGSNKKMLDNIELIVQQLNLVSGSTSFFDSTSSGTLIFQGNLTLDEVSISQYSKYLFCVEIEIVY
jgi:hypothetical protein